MDNTETTPKTPKSKKKRHLPSSPLGKGIPKKKLQNEEEEHESAIEITNDNKIFCGGLLRDIKRQSKFTVRPDLSLNCSCTNCELTTPRTNAQELRDHWKNKHSKEIGTNFPIFCLCKQLLDIKDLDSHINSEHALLQGIQSSPVLSEVDRNE